MNKYSFKALISLIIVLMAGITYAQNSYPIQEVPFTSVKIDDDFWQERQETSKSITIPYCFQKCEETGRISNFAKAGGLVSGNFEGIYYNDSDLYKVIEGAAYSLQNHPDPQLEKYVDGIIDKIAAAQWDDGYLYTYYSLPEHQPEKRWSNIESHHELYCVGHFYEAAVAYYRTTGKRKILDMAIKNADLIDSVFGQDKKHAAPGHEEIEIGLIKLYQVSGEERYLNLAKFFLDQRGRKDQRSLFGTYLQDHKPVIEQKEAVGHAVRAGYLYSAMADVAAITGDKKYSEAIDQIWKDVVNKKLYITGGIGSNRSHEAFGNPYELPNLTAYNETCAAIANVFWNYRMFMLHGETKYIDVLENSLYNNVISGVSLSGDRFFYPNPLVCDGKYKFNHGSLIRKPWFNTSCCPVNIARIIPSLGGYIYAQKEDSIYVNLYIGSTVKVKMKGKEILLSMQTDYPRSGKVTITMDTKDKSEWSLYLRIPGWAMEKPIPSDLYSYLFPTKEKFMISLNGKNIKYQMENGFAVIHRSWQAGDTVSLNFPMPVRRIIANEKVKNDSGLVAIQRGPLIYCAEGVDNTHFIRNLALPDDRDFVAEYNNNLLDGITVVTVNGLKKVSGKDEPQPAKITLIPYYAWAHRGANEMAVWLPRDIDLAKLAATFAPIIWPTDTIMVKPGKVTISLKEQLEESKIYYTTDNSDPTIHSPLYTQPFVINENTMLKCRAFKNGLEASELVKEYYSFIDKKINGLTYTYFEGRWNKLPDFESLKPVKTGITYSFNPTPLSLREDEWGLLFKGFIQVNQDDEYTFYTESNDGSKLFIDNKPVVDNDGKHGVQSRNGNINLTKGFHPIEVFYFESGGSEFLKLFYESSEFEKMEIPASVLFRYKE